MSNFLAVATVSAALSRVLAEALDADIPGARVTMLRPDGDGVPAPSVNIYLYQVTQNAAWRNANLPVRGGDGRVVDRPRAALDLHYLLSFTGNDGELEPQRMLGSTVRTLESRPTLSRQQVRDTVADATYPYLAGSNLAEQIEVVKFSPLPMTLEELSKLWSVFFQVKYTLSVAYLATVVLIESDDVPRAPLPVQARNVYVVPFRQPVIEQVIAEEGANKPILIDSNIAIVGRELRGEPTTVRLAGEDVEPAAAEDSQVVLRLSDLPEGLLKAGVQGVQVVHPMKMGTPPTPHAGVESNVGAFVLRPRISRVRTSGMAGRGDAPRSGNVTVDLEPVVGRNQRVRLLLNESPNGGSSSSAFPGPDRSEDTDSIRFAIEGVRAGDYLVRIQVDGAESPLDVDDAGNFTGPGVTIR